MSRAPVRASGVFAHTALVRLFPSLYLELRKQIRWFGSEDFSDWGHWLYRIAHLYRFNGGWVRRCAMGQSAEQ